jgi:hypothetical protein
MKKEEFLKIISEHPQYLPDILAHIHTLLKEYKNICRKENDLLLREALGDAVHLLGMKRKPDHEFMKKMCIRIKNAIFKDGVNSYHHEGERTFYNKYLKE